MKSLVEIKEIIKSVFSEFEYVYFYNDADEMEVILLVEDHTDDVYEKVVRGEDELYSILDLPIDVRVRALQGKSPEYVYPTYAERIV